MTCDEIIEELKANASEKYKANVVKMGILAIMRQNYWRYWFLIRNQSFGVSKGFILVGRIGFLFYNDVQTGFEKLFMGRHGATGCFLFRNYCRHRNICLIMQLQSVILISISICFLYFCRYTSNTWYSGYAGCCCIKEGVMK